MPAHPVGQREQARVAGVAVAHPVLVLLAAALAADLVDAECICRSAPGRPGSGPGVPAAKARARDGLVMSSPGAAGLELSLQAAISLVYWRSVSRPSSFCRREHALQARQRIERHAPAGDFDQVVRVDVAQPREAEPRRAVLLDRCGASLAGSPACRRRCRRRSRRCRSMARACRRGGTSGRGEARRVHRADEVALLGQHLARRRSRASPPCCRCR